MLPIARLPIPRLFLIYRKLGILSLRYCCGSLEICLLSMRLLLYGYIWM